MPKDSGWSAIGLSDDGSTVIFHPTLPHRGLGRAMAIAAAVLMVVLLILIVAAVVDDRTPWSIVYLLAFVGLLMMPPLGMSLHLATRRGVTSLSPREVVYERASWLRQRSERYALSDFAGLRRHTKTAPEVDAGTVAHATLGAIFGLLAAAAGGGVHVMARGKIVTFHCLSLSPRDGLAKDIPLVMDRDAGFISEVTCDLAQRFSLDVLVPSGDGHAALRPDEIELTLGERMAVGEPAKPLGAPPGRLEVREENGRTTVLFPPHPVAAIAGACFGAAFMALVVVSLAAGVDWPLVIVPFAFAVGFGLLGFLGYRRRSEVVIGPEGVAFRKLLTYPVNKDDRFVQWRELRHVTVAAPRAMGIKGREVLHVMTDSGDFFVANPRLKEEESRWLAEAVTAAARRYAYDDALEGEEPGGESEA